MLHQLLFGLLLGWGAAIPLGPINLEIIRRNLRLGTLYGISLGLGACLADITYLVLLSLGTLVIFTHPLTLKIVGILGSLILAWFGISALRMKASNPHNHLSAKSYPAWAHTLEGYILTLLNPMTILFWASVSAQVAISAQQTTYAVIYAGIGVFCGTLSWILVFNMLLHYTRHRLSPAVVQSLNYLGGLILLAYAVHGLWRVLF